MISFHISKKKDKFELAYKYLTGSVAKRLMQEKTYAAHQSNIGLIMFKLNQTFSDFINSLRRQASKGSRTIEI